MIRPEEASAQPIVVLVGVNLLADDVDGSHVAQAVSDLLALAVAQTEAGGKLAARKRFRQCRGQEGGKVGWTTEAVLGLYADENLIVDAPAAAPPTAAARHGSAFPQPRRAAPPARTAD